jgi:hypothetical protein
MSSGIFWTSCPDDVRDYYFQKVLNKLSINGSTYAGARVLHREYAHVHGACRCARVHVHAYHLYDNTFWIHLRFQSFDNLF